MHQAWVAFGIALLAAVADGRDTCRRCDTTGRVVNPYWEDHAAEEEVGATSCSVVHDRDPAGAGQRWLPCPRCRRQDLSQPVAAEVAARAAELAAWVEERRGIDRELGVAMVHLRTPHFLLSWVPKKIKASNGRVLDAHLAAHLYARRLEGMYRDWQALFGIDDARMRNTLHQVLIFDRLRDMSRACTTYLSMTSDTSAKLAGDPSYLITWWDRANLPDDRALDQHVVHHVTHLLAGVFHLKRWLQPYGFLDEGMAHWMEVRYFRGSGNSCNAEEMEEPFTNRDWVAEALGEVNGAAPPSLVDLMNKDTFQLHKEDHYLAFAVFDHLMSRGPERVRDLMVRLKEQEGLRESLQAAFGVNLLELQEQCLAWVRETYPTRLADVPEKGAPDPGEVLRGLAPPPDEATGGRGKRRD